MSFKIFMLLVLLLGVGGLYTGIKRVKKNTGKYNLLDAISSLFTGTFQYTGIGRLTLGILLIDVALMFLIR